MRLTTGRLKMHALNCFIIIAFLSTSITFGQDTSQCWWSGCQPSVWAVRGCPANFTENGQQGCETANSTKYFCCPIPPVTTTTPAPTLTDCWWSGCQPLTWAVRGCPQERVQAEMRQCEDNSTMFQCCLEGSPTTPEPIPIGIISSSCWWTGCQAKDWAVRGCPKDMTTVDFDICGNETSPGDMYRCCNSVLEGDNEGLDICWWSSCKKSGVNGCPSISVSSDVMPCDVDGDQYYCCLKIPGAVDKEVDSLNITFYQNYARYLLLQSIGFQIVPELLKCTDVDPEKSYVFTIEDDEDAIRVCDLCPNFPLDKLSNIVINRPPSSVLPNNVFSDCFGLCYETDECVALSYDIVTSICYLYNGTLGEFTQENGWTTVLISQPTGVLQKWMYSRHTSVSGTPLATSTKNSFISCLDTCEETANCTHVSYNFFSSQCQLFDGIHNYIGVDLLYGNVMGYDIEVTSDQNNVQWRFTEYIDLTVNETELVNITVSNTNSTCPKPTQPGTNIIFSPTCTTGGLGCDTATGCLTCYYPEIIMAYRQDLPVCSDSTVRSRGTTQNKLQFCFQSCFVSSTCMGFDFKNTDNTCSFLTFNSFIPDPDVQALRYYLQYPKPSDINRGNFLKFSLIPNHDILFSGSTWSKTPTTTNWNDCLSDCLKEDACVKVAYSFSSKVCKLASRSVSHIDNRLDKKKDYQLFLRQPALNSIWFPYKVTPGWYIPTLNSSSVRSYQCGDQDCSLQVQNCVNSCSIQYGNWCQQISVEYNRTNITCNYFNWDANFTLAPKPNAEVLTVKFSLKTVNLEALNNITTFQPQDLTTCFQNNNYQSQSTLVTNDQVLDFGSSEEPTGRSIRRRRNIFKKIGNAFKKLGNAIVNTVKSVATTVVDTVKNVGKTIGKVVTGDFKGAKDAFLNIPIVKSGKEAVENVITLGKSVVTGNWKEAKNAALGLASAAIDFVPGPGKILKDGAKALKDVIGIGSKTVQKDVGKSSKDQVGKSVNKDRNANSDKPSKPDESTPDRCRRATPPNKRTSPGSGSNCNQPNKKRTGNCPDLNKRILPNLLDPLDCKNVKQRETCGFECDLGFNENPITLQCSAAASGKPPDYLPSPRCEQENCGRGNYPIIQVRVPNPVSVAGRRTRISAFVLQIDRIRRLPVWSLAFQNEMNNVKKPKQTRKNSFYDYECLGNNQPKDSDFPVQPAGFKLIHRGHLTPANVMLFSGKAAKAINLYINIAPQDGMTNSVYWGAIEAQVQCFTQRFSSLVLTGICPDSRGKTPRGLDIPQCYWKMICYRVPENKGQTVVIGFLTDNTAVQPTDDILKAARKEQLSVPVSQSTIERRMSGSPVFSEPWVKGGRYVLVGRDVTDAPNPLECAAAANLDQKEADLWEKSIRGGSPNSSCVVDRCRRQLALSNTRGCTASEAKSMAAFLGLASIFMSDLENNIPDDESDSIERGDGGNLVPAAKCNKRIIGYYPSWGLGKFSFKQAQKLTHIVYAFLEMKADGTIQVGNPDATNTMSSDEVTATAQTRLQQLMDQAKEFAHLKIMFAVGGWENSMYFSSVAASPQMRMTFIASAIQNIETWGFDGIDIDWEYPVTGGAHEGIPDDKSNYVELMKELRTALDQLAINNGRTNNPYLLSFAGAAGQWTLDPGYDLPNLLKYANWVNVMTYDFFGAWASEWGAYTGPPAPLFFGMPPRYSGKTNVDWTMKYYACRSNRPHQINMGLPFYGRYWNNVGAPIDASDGMWRQAARANGVFQGGYVGWKDIVKTYLPNSAFEQIYSEKVEAPYLWNAGSQTYVGYENQRSLKAKANYAVTKNLGGLMIWAIDQDDTDFSMLNSIFDADLCSNTVPSAVNFKCSPITEKRWWTSEDGLEVAGLCGRSAPLYKGYYPVCDPDDPGYGCCGAFGYCGSGDTFCKCATCVDYGNNPEEILHEPIRPTVPVQWYFLNAPDGERGRCGTTAPKLNGQFPICNPDDPNAHCCSSGNFCGTGAGFCECNGCVDFTKDPNHKF